MSKSPRSNRSSIVDPFDFLDLDALLTDEERMVRETVRDFVKQRVLPVVDDWFERGHFDKSVIKELGALGLLGMHLHGYGCAGTNAVSYGITCMEMEAGDSGFRSAVSVQGSLSMWPIWRYGSEEQKERWLPPMAAGEIVGCFGLTEPDFGSDPSGMRTFARHEDVDHERRHRRRGGGVGPDRRRHPRVRRPSGHQGLRDQGHRAQALAAGVGHL